MLVVPVAQLLKLLQASGVPYGSSSIGCCGCVVVSLNSFLESFADNIFLVLVFIPSYEMHKGMLV